MVRHPRVIVLCLLSLLAASVAVAQTKGGKAKRESPQGEGEHARLQREIDANRAILLRVIQMEREHLDLILKLVQESEKGGSLSSNLSRSTAPDSEDDGSGDAALLAPLRSGSPTKNRRDSRSAYDSAYGALVGSVKVEGGEPGEAAVYVADVRNRPAHEQTFSIRQINKQFDPRVAVVARGTKVVFPNGEAVFHNVFSLSPGNTFDLGTYRAGDKPGSVVLTNPGVVKVFCNLHSQMSASILVAPSTLFAKVGSDGTFRINNVPVGHHRIGAWAPNGDPVIKEIDVSSGENPLSFALSNKPGGTAHTNKLGQPYGSYNE